MSLEITVSEDTFKEATVVAIEKFDFEASNSVTDNELGLPMNAQMALWDTHTDNPLNWSLSKKAYHAFAAAVLAFSVSCGSSLITPSVFVLMDEFNISLTTSVLVLTVYVLGLCFGPMIAAPISETSGRKPVYLVSSVAYMLLVLGTAFCHTYPALLACRFFAGMAGAPVLAVGAGTNADMFGAKWRCVAASFFIGMPFLGPSLGPVIGSLVVYTRDSWQWTQYATLMIAFIAFLLVLPMSETYGKIILKKRAKSGHSDIVLPEEPVLKPLEKLKLLFTITLFTPIKMLLTEPIVSLFAIYNALGFAILFSLFEAYPYVFITVYGFNTWQWGITFLGVGLGVALAVLTTILVDQLYYQKHYERAASQGKMVEPERRLLAAQLGSLGIPAGLFWFAWTAHSNSIHWMVPITAGVVFAWGNVCVFICACIYLVDVYGPLNGASALAANGLLRYALAATFPLFIVQMYENLGIGWATSTFAFATVVMVPIPYAFYVYGPRLRAASRIGTVAT